MRIKYRLCPPCRGRRASPLPRGSAAVAGALQHPFCLGAVLLCQALFPGISGARDTQQHAHLAQQQQQTGAAGGEELSLIHICPWLSKCDINDEHLIAISHGEGRFVCNEQLLNQLIDNGQIATQYVDLLCRPTMDMRYNPNGSVLAIEGITSPDGRVFGKMGHSERSGEQLYKNVTGDKYQPIFEGGVNYFKL